MRKRNRAAKKVFLSIYHYFCFFLIMAAIITCCMLLFVSTMSDSMGIELTEENINTAAILTFWNVVFLSLICTVIDAFRRKIAVDRPVKEILSAAERIARGDYSVRIPPLGGISRADGLDKIVECYNKMAEELSGVESMQTDFIANVSHELKAPLAVMQNYGVMLRSPDITHEERLKYAEAITSACDRLSDLVTNILRLNKLENRQVYPNTKIFDLGEQICECLIGFENAWEEKSIEIETDIAEDVYIETDPELLSLIWNNLISNGLKFTSPGGNMKVSLSVEEDMARVTVADTGCGITPEVGKHMFDKFYQGDNSHSTRGNGLGLALVKRVVDIVGADILVESRPGVGSSFTIKLRRSKNGTVSEDNI